MAPVPLAAKPAGLPEDLWPSPEVDRRLRIMFLMLHPGYVRNFESTLRLLLERGHSIQLAFAIPTKQITDRLAERLADEYDQLTIVRAVKPARNGWRNLARTLDSLADYSRYMHPRFAHAEKLRARVGRKVLSPGTGGGVGLAPLRVAYMAAFSGVRSAEGSDRLVRFWLRISEQLPSRREIVKFITAYDPDVVLVTPLVTVGSHEPEFLHASRRLGIPTALCVASWDNLTNKGLIKGSPDRVFVWNEIQRREAVEMHGVRPEKVLVTGAQRFDDWFTAGPTWSRDEFCDLAGLPADRPYLLYVCSSPFIAEDEVAFVHRFLTALRGHGSPGLRDIGVLIRPHPQNAAQWQDANLGDLGPVSIWPRAGAQPVTDTARAVFYDSIHHSAAVLGINTSAQIEAGIIGREVHTLLTPDFRDTQEGTLHFHYLLHQNGGLLHAADSLGQLLANLQLSIEGGHVRGLQARPFLESFVRPYGLDVPGTPILAGSIERVATLAPTGASRRCARERLARFLLAPFALLGTPVDAKFAREVRTRVPRAAGKHVRGMLPQPYGKPSQPTLTGKQRDARAIKAAFSGTGNLEEPPLILAGPFLGPTHHELLYWIPFLRWVTAQHHVDRSRLIAVSRGSAASWYRGVAGQYLDVLDVVDEEALARFNGLEEKTSPGGGVSRSDELVARLRESTGAEMVILPSVLRHVLGRYRQGRAPIAECLRHLDLRRIRPPVSCDLDGRLPEDFVAMQLAFGPWFPDADRNRDAAESVIAKVGEQAAVVLIDPPAWDGLVPIELKLPGPHVLRLSDLAGCDGGALELASACMARARGFVGTYGGAAYLARCHGLGAIALYADRSRLPQADIDVVQRLSIGRPGWLLPLHVDQLETVGRRAARFGAAAPVDGRVAP